MTLLNSIWERTKQDIYATTNMKVGGYQPPKDTKFSSVAIPNIGSSAITSSVLKDKNILQKAGETFKSLPFVKKVGVVASAPVVTGVTVGIVSNPVKTVKGVSKFSSSSYEFGKDFTNLVYNPSIENAKSFGKEHPYGTTALGVGTLGVIGYKSSSYLNTAYNSYLSRQMLGYSKADVPSAKDVYNNIKNNPSIPDSPIIPDFKDKDKEYIPKSTPPQYNNVPPSSQPSYSNGGTGLSSVGNRETSNRSVKRYKKKPQSLYTRPINIRNHIVIANKNG